MVYVQMHLVGGGEGLELIKLLTSFIQQMHEMKQGRIQDFSYVSQNFVFNIRIKLNIS